MPRILLFCFLLVFVGTLSGCAFPQGISQEAVEARGTELDDLSRSRIVSVVDEPYLGARPVPLPKNAEFSSGIFSKQVVLNKFGSLEELCATVSKLIELPIIVDSPVAPGATKASASKGSELDAQLAAALGTGKSSVASGAGDIPQSRSRGIRVVYEGTVKGLLDALAARSGLAWDYNADEGVVFSSTTIRTFTIWAAPGKVTFTNKITNQSKEQPTSGGGMGGSVSSQDSSIQTAQTHTTDLSFDIWKDIETGVKALLSPGGSVVSNQAAGTVTVKDTAVAIRKIGKFIDDQNERLSRQIALSIKVWSLELADATDAGLNLQMLFENPDVKVFAGSLPMKWLGLGGELSAAVVDGKLKDSTAVLRALRSVGQATQVTSGGGVVMNNQPVPVQAVKREAYLASASISTSDYGETSQLMPGEVTTGFAMTVIPHILESRRVVLNYTVNLSSLDDLTEFSTGDSRIQLPKVSTRSFSQRMALKMGQTLVLAGFEQEMDGRNTSGGLLGFGKTRDYRKSLIVITISTESGDV